MRIRSRWQAEPATSALIAIAILMAILGTEDQFIIPAVTIGASICVATSMCADMMADLKTGYLIGSRPVRQQIAQIVTCWIGPSIALGTVIVLWQAYAFGPEQARILSERAAAAGPEAVSAYQAAGGSATRSPILPQPSSFSSPIQERKSCSRASRCWPNTTVVAAT